MCHYVFSVIKGIIVTVMIAVIFSAALFGGSAVDHRVPFLCQAPFGDWREPWQDSCEEASIIMAMRFVSGRPISRESGKREILALVKYQVENYGGHYDLTAGQSAKLIKDYYKHEVEIRRDVSIREIKGELAKGNLVIAPMAGRELGNPYFTPPGPAYHYLVIKGYDDARGIFITNDPGTRRGANYNYKYRTLFQALHDWTGDKKTIDRGQKTIIVVKL